MSSKKKRTKLGRKGTLNDLSVEDVEGQRVLIRVDFNVPLKGKTITNTQRYVSSRRFYVFFFKSLSLSLSDDDDILCDDCCHDDGYIYVVFLEL